MAYQPYEFLFTDQNPNREFVIQPYTMNGPSSPDGGIDPSAANANTTLFLYGKGSPNYGDRIQENLVYMLEHFFSPIEPSFPIPGQLWCRSAANELTTPFQMFMFNPRQITITASSTNQLYVVSDDGSLTQAQVLQRFINLGLAKQFTVYDSAYNQLVFVQSALPVVSGPSNVLLTVTPVVANSLVGQYIGGWEEIYQGNAEVVLRRPFNAGGYNLINLANPVNPQDAATKSYVDTAIGGGTLKLGNLVDVRYQNYPIQTPQTGSFLYFDGTYWTDLTLGSFGFLPLAGGTMTGVISMGGNTISNLPLPGSPFDAATKAYVDTQPLSGTNVTLTTPQNLDLLVYNTGSTKWINSTAISAGLVPISGAVTMGGFINMGNNTLTGVPNPISPTDAVNLQYLNSVLAAGSGVVTGGTFNNVAGTLTLTLSGAFAPVTIGGFLPTPNNQVPSQEVVFVPQNPSSLPLNPSNQFLNAVLGDATIVGPSDIQDPINPTLNAILNQVDTALGNFVVPRQRFAFPAPASGTQTAIDINNGAGITGIVFPPSNAYVKGSENLAVYINGVKQVASIAGFAKIISSFTIGATYSGVAISSSPPGITIPGNVTRIFHSGVQFNISGSGSANNNGNWIVTNSTFSSGNTFVTVIPNEYNLSATQSTLVTGTGNITYTVNDLRANMETGYTGSTPLTLTVNVNGLGNVTVSLNPSVTYMYTLGLLRDAINSYAYNYYVNPIIAIASGFTVPGNRATQFTAGTNFVVRYSTNNNNSYTVQAGGAVYSAGPNTTFIPTTSSPVASPVDGVIFQDKWGFAMTIQNGSIVFYSNTSGTGSSVVVTDPGSGTGLFSGLSGITWPITFTGNVNPTPLASTTNPIVPTDYGYREIGMYGYQSSLFEFLTAPTPVDYIEVLIDREMVYVPVNPFAVATISP